MEHSPIEHTLLPFRRRWHVIDEADIARLLADHARMRELCQDLESLADRLCGHLPLHERCAAADRLQETMLDHVKATSTFFGQVFRGERLSYEGGVLARILTRQIADAIHAEDVADALREEVLDAADINILAYMLRCVFENCRRALDFEQLSLLSIAAHRLTAAARTSLQQLLARPQDVC